MNERLSNQPERDRTEAEAKQYEAGRIAIITGLLWEAFNREIDGQDAADGAMDEIVRLCESLAQRDPEMGAYLLEALNINEKASAEPEPTESVRKALGLPVPDYAAMMRAEKAARDQAWSESDPAPPPEHNQ